jgi:CRISPR-associated protein Csd2
MDYPKDLTDSTRRHDFVMLFDVTDGNPNGDPDAGNLPRVDPETMHGIVTDVCLKRKVRNYIAVTQIGQEKMNIYVEHHGVLNEQHQKAYVALGLTSSGAKEKPEVISKTRAWMCRNFYDIRTFGAVMTTEVNCGQVRGPVQLTFARSLDRITPLDLSITRVAVTRAEDKVKVDDETGEGTTGKVTEMGRKAIVPYGLYRSHGFFNPRLAEDTNFDDNDLQLFWDALQEMWDLDRSASRGMMAIRGLYVFTHEDALGKAPAHKLFDRIKVERRIEATAPRTFDDYTVTINETEMPQGVLLNKIVG